MNLAAVLDNLERFRGVEWSLDGNTLDGLTIHTPDITPPTQREVDAVWTELGPRLAADVSARREKERTRIPRLEAVEASAKKTKEEADKALTILALKRKFAVLSQEVATLTAIVKELASR